jgi:hypothetical protein
MAARLGAFGVSGTMHLQKVTKFIAEALECSVFANPREPGLTYAEILEIGARAGFREGEIGDAFARMGLHSMGRGSKLLSPDHQTCTTWKFFLPETPEYRDVDAFDFIYTEFGELGRNLGQAKTQMERGTCFARRFARYFRDRHRSGHHDPHLRGMVDREGWTFAFRGAGVRQRPSPKRTDETAAKCHLSGHARPSNANRERRDLEKN